MGLYKDKIKSITENISFEEGIPVHVQVLNVTHYPLHNHNHKQVLLVLNGEIDLRLSYMNYRLKQNDLHIINVRDTHMIDAVGDKALILVLTLDTGHFEKKYPDFIYTVFISYRDAAQKNSAKLSILRSLIFRIASEFIKRGDGYLKRLIESANAFMYHLHEDFQFFKVNEDKKFLSLEDYALNKAQYERINRIIIYIYAHFNEKISLSLLAEREHVSKYYLSHLIKNMTGESFQNFHSMTRVEMSEAPLLETQRSIYQISQDCGFSNMNYYISHFKKWFGMEPWEYREKFKLLSIIDDDGIFERLDMDVMFSRISGPDTEFGAGNNKYSEKDICFELCIDRNTAQGKKFNVFSGCHIVFSNDNILHNPYMYELLRELDETGGESNLKIKPPANSNGIKEINEENDSLDGAFRLFEKIMKHDKLLLLKELYFDDQTFPMNLELLDSEFNGGIGLVSRSGLKKPLFYAVSFLLQLGRSLISSNSNHILTRQGDEFIILLVFDENISISTKKLILNLKGFTSTQIISIQTMSKTTPNAAAFWKDMGAPDTLDIDKVKLINEQTHPYLRYNVLPKGDFCEFEIDIHEKSFLLVKIKPL